MSNESLQTYRKRVIILDIRDLRARLRNTHGPDHQFTACCPGHDDKYASLSVAVTDDGKILLNCHAGCKADVIVEVLGLTMSDLFAISRETGPKPRRVAAEYIYTDAGGTALYKTVRYDPKDFRQFRAAPDNPGCYFAK